MKKPRAMVLGAGFGTRLRPLTDELPKPLIPLGDRPLVAHIAERLAAHGRSDFVLNVHYLEEKFNNNLKEIHDKIHLVHELEILGTAGGIQGAARLFGAPPIIVWNGDILADPPISELEALASGGGLAFAVAPRPAGSGTVGLGTAGEVVRLRGERFGAEVSGGDYVGIAALGGDALAALPSQGCLIGDVALPFLRRGQRILTAAVTGEWRDVGSMEAYRNACRRWLVSHASSGTSWVHPAANVEPGITVRSSIVSEGATVTGEGTLTGVVAWPGAHVVAPLAEAVVTTSGRVVAFPQ